jgi:beta-glucosidase
MAPSDIAKADIDELVEKLTTDEAILLTAGVGFWHTHDVPRLGVPAIKAGLSKTATIILSDQTLLVV